MGPEQPFEPVAALARLASIVESSEDAIISKDLNGIVLTWNRGAAAIYGYSAEEIIGESINLLLPPARMDEEAEILRRIRNGERVHHFDTVRIRKGGTPIHVSLTISPVREGGTVVGASHVARDISERKRLESAHARLAAIVESSEDAILSEGLDGTIQTWNASATRVYGYERSEAIGRDVSFLLPKDRIREEEEIMAKLRRGERIEHFETTRLRKDQRLIEISLSVSPILDASGAIIGASHVARDITERRAFEQQLRQTQRLESLGVLAGGIAHDFNNLLTGILGNASLTQETLPAAHPARSYMQDLILAAERAADLTRQLLAYSGKGQFVVGPANIADLVAEISTLVKASLPKSVTMRLELDRNVPLVSADPTQIQQLVMNMVINGAEAVGEQRLGTVVVRTGTQQIDEQHVRALFPTSPLTPGEYAYIEVQDDGCGMDEATKERIFDPFFTTKFTGRGLGLAAVLGIVNAHKGAIRVYSAPGEGTTFKVFLPAIASSPPRQPRFAASKGTILVVDDEDIVRKIAKSALEHSGYRVLLASHGQEAIEILRSAPAHISLVVLDLTMPLISGEATLAQLREIRPDIPIILSSGYSEADATSRFAREALDGFVQKPYTSAQLRDRVQSVLAGRE